MPYPVGARQAAEFILGEVQQPTTIVDIVWNFGANAGRIYESYAPTEAVAVAVSKTNFRVLGASPDKHLYYHWRAPGNYHYTARMTYNHTHEAGLHADREGDEVIVGPVVLEAGCTLGVMQIGQEHLDFEGDDSDGEGDDSDGEGDGGGGGAQIIDEMRVAYAFNARVRLPAADGGRGGGTVACFQTVHSQRSYTPWAGEAVTLNTERQVLDNSVPYDDGEDGERDAVVNVTITDRPNMWLPRAGCRRVTINDEFVTYLMYKAGGEDDATSMWVCLGRLAWAAICEATKADAHAAWVLVDDFSHPGAFVEDNTLPVWNGNIRTFGVDFATRFRARIPDDAAAAWFPVSGRTARDDRKRLYKVNADPTERPGLKLALANAIQNRLGPWTGGGYLVWMAPDRVSAARAVDGVSFVNEVAVTDRLPQTRRGSTPNFDGETEYVVSVAPACWARSEAEAQYWRPQTFVNRWTLSSEISRLAAPRTVTCEPASGYGRYSVRFSSAPGEAVIRRLAEQPYVRGIELKQHFYPGPGPVDPNLQ